MTYDARLKDLHICLIEYGHDRSLLLKCCLCRNENEEYVCYCYSTNSSAVIFSMCQLKKHLLRMMMPDKYMSE